jgi:hypothetical protein
MKETFEFWCSTSGGGCGGYFRARLRTNINGDYTVVCPKCKHKHNRKVKNGQITNGRCNGEAGRGKTEELLVPMSAYSEEPVLEASTRQETATKLKTKPRPQIEAVQEQPEEDTHSRRKGITYLWGRFFGRPQ